MHTIFESENKYFATRISVREQVFGRPAADQLNRWTRYRMTDQGFLKNRCPGRPLTPQYIPKNKKGHRDTKGDPTMTDDTFKELIVNFLNAIYLNLRYMNHQIPKEEYDYCSEKADEAILRLITRDTE